MAFRDETEALRARIATLEAQLRDATPTRARLVSSSIPSGLFERTVKRHSHTIDGIVSHEALEAMRQLLWAKLGGSIEDAGDEDPPGDLLLKHVRGPRTVRVVTSNGKTHLSLDHRKWGAAKVSALLAALAVLLPGAMALGGVHDDWNQMFMGLYAIAVLLLGPLAWFGGLARDSESSEVLMSMVEIAKAHPEGPSRARIDVEAVQGEGDVSEERNLPPTAARRSRA